MSTPAWSSVPPRQARGGAARFAAVHSLSFTGRLVLAGGKAAPLAVWLAPHLSRIRIELTLPAGKLVQGYDGFQAWQIAPGETQAQPLAGAAARQVETKPSISWNLWPIPTSTWPWPGRVIKAAMTSIN
ncbi:MAG TPA: hypothetical protein VNF74_03705 [Terriglobales bacterium]|nr:hypothetical protein [Terriglobales bacterium]